MRAIDVHALGSQGADIFGRPMISMNLELAALVYDRNPREIYPHGGRAGNGAFNVFRELYCPGCGVQLDVESITPGLPITEKVARNLYGLHQQKVVNAVGIHLDTINLEVFSRLHENPKELSQRIRGYRCLLEAGYPPKRITPCITLTSVSAETVEETIDWFHDQMGATRFLQLQVFNPLGRARNHAWLEPGLSQVRRAYEYRAQKYGVMDWLRTGSMDWGKHQCSSLLTLLCDGSVMPCGQLPREFAVGNFYRQRLDDILPEHRTVLARKDLKIKGKCTDCENNDICWGCRASAYYYLGDMEASDPKCWRNPEARETYLRQ